MKRKEMERFEAIRLRKDGNSVKRIAKIIGVSTASVSVWVRDVKLTDSQKADLQMCSANAARMNKVWEVHHRKAIERRRCWMEDGKMMARRISGDDFKLGCSLYWAEGSKDKNTVQFVNTDVEMMKFFIRFLREFFGVRNDEISIVLKFYSGNGISFENAVEYWLGNLGLSKESMRKSQVDVIRGDGYGKKNGKRPYGTCRLTVGRTDIAQKIFGAVQEIFGFEREEW